MSEEQARRVQAQFGASAAAYVTSPLHAAGEDLDRLLAWGAARRADRVLDVATGGGHTALAFAGIVRRVVAYDLTGADADERRARTCRTRSAANVDFVAGMPTRCPSGTSPSTSSPAGRRRIISPTSRPPSVRSTASFGRAARCCCRTSSATTTPDANAFILEVEKRRDPSHVRSYRAAQWKAFLRAAGLTVIEDSLIWKLREWNEWTGRMRMSAEARRDLEDFVRRAPERCRAAFEFRLTRDAVVSFNDRQILIRADRD